MGFENVTNEEFLEWFNDSVNLFRELTASLNYDEKRRLTDDPGILFSIYILNLLKNSPIHIFFRNFVGDPYSGVKVDALYFFKPIQSNE